MVTLKWLILDYMIGSYCCLLPTLNKCVSSDWLQVCRLITGQSEVSIVLIDQSKARRGGGHWTAVWSQCPAAVLHSGSVVSWDMQQASDWSTQVTWSLLASDWPAAIWIQASDWLTLRHWWTSWYHNLEECLVLFSSFPCEMKTERRDSEVIPGYKVGQSRSVNKL